MDNLLAQIVATKRKEVEVLKKKAPLAVLREIVDQFPYESISLSDRLARKPGIIAEFKRASPSKGPININADIAMVVKGYASAGASAVSVLTDASYFQSKPDDFKQARKIKEVPLLRKEFIIDEYQLYESRALGANVVLLIAAILTKEQIQNFTKLAHELGMEVLLELHDEVEIKKISGLEDMMGVNNRNLKTFEVDIKHSAHMSKKLANYTIPLIAESGLSGIKEVKYLASEGFKGFLMGEYFMKQSSPAESLKEFMNNLQKL